MLSANNAPCPGDHTLAPAYPSQPIKPLSQVSHVPLWKAGGTSPFGSHPPCLPSSGRSHMQPACGPVGKRYLPLPGTESVVLRIFPVCDSVPLPIPVTLSWESFLFQQVNKRHLKHAMGVPTLSQYPPFPDCQWPVVYSLSAENIQWKVLEK